MRCAVKRNINGSLVFSCALTFVFVYLFLQSITDRNIRSHYSSGDQVLNRSRLRTIYIGSTICGGLKQMKKALTMMKSAILFRGNLHVHFLVVCSKNLQALVHSELQILSVRVDDAFSYEIHNLFYPKQNTTLWRYWFKECASESLFFPNIFPTLGKMVYVDNDVIFLNNLSDLWQHAYKMNRSQFIATAPDYLDLNELLRVNKPEFPLNLAPSLNTGVLILDTKKMMEFGWYPFILKMAQAYSRIAEFADQDIIKLALFFHPDKLYPLSCKYNFHTYTCKSKFPCEDVRTDGVSILHGCAEGYESIPEFTAIWNAFQEYKIGVDPMKHLLELLKNEFNKLGNHLNCEISTATFLKNINRTLSSA